MKITDIKPMPYKPGELSYYQFIRGGIGSDYHQGPSFFSYEDGKVLLYWHAYDFDECSGNGVVLYSVSEDYGVTWSDPQVFMADYLGGVPGFIHMLRLSDSDKAIMLHTRTRHHIEVDKKLHRLVKGSNYFQSTTRLFIRRSEDKGHTFDAGEELPWDRVSGGKELPVTKFYGGIDSLIQLKNGRIVAAFTFLDPDCIGDLDNPKQHYAGACLLSDDGGQTWTRSEEITVDTLRGVMEIQLAETEPNRILGLFRTKGGYVYQTVSLDGGKTWSRSEPSSLTAPESITRMIRLQSGNLLAVRNNASSTTQHPRYPLVATVSKDGGRTWSEPKMIANETGTNQLSNHGMIQLEDGRILLGISHYRAVHPATSDLDFAVFDEKWLMK
jgi:sialidase-1